MDTNTTVVDALQTVTVGDIATMLQGVAVVLVITIGIMFVAVMLTPPKF